MSTNETIRRKLNALRRYVEELKLVEVYRNHVQDYLKFADEIEASL